LAIADLNYRERTTRPLKSRVANRYIVSGVWWAAVPPNFGLVPLKITIHTFKNCKIFDCYLNILSDKREKHPRVQSSANLGSSVIMLKFLDPQFNRLLSVQCTVLAALERL